MRASAVRDGWRQKVPASGVGKCAATCVRRFAAGLALVAAGAAAAASVAAAPTYGEHLAEQALAAHPGLTSLHLHVRPLEGAPDVVVGVGSGVASRAEVQAYIDGKGGETAHVSTVGSTVQVVLPLLNVDRRTIGACVLRFAAQSGRKADEVLAESRRVAGELRRRIFDAANLLEPYPYVDGLPLDTVAQHLVDRMLGRHDDIVVLALHAPPRAGAGSAILGSSFGRIGKLDDEGDLVVIRTGEPNMRVVAAGDRFNFGLPLRDAAGNTVGLMSIAFAYRLGQDVAPLLRKAEAIRDGLGKDIRQVGTLSKQYAPEGGAT